MFTVRQRLAGLSPTLVPRVQAIGRAVEARHWDEAERGVIAAMAVAPEHPEVRRLFGLTQLARGHHQEAIEALVSARSRQPDDPLIHNALGAAYEAILDYPRAEAALKRACELWPEQAANWYNLGKVLVDSGDIDAAAPVLQKAAALAPRHEHVRTMLADIERTEGRVREAERQFRGVLKQHPGCGAAWWGLATIKPMPLAAAEIEQMQRELRAAGGESDRIRIGFALASALDHSGDREQAFAVLRETNARARRLQAWNAAAHSDNVDAVLTAFSAVPLTAESGQGNEVIFIASLPRSGSTLVEQIIASHSQVEGTTELPHVAQIIREESERRGQVFPHWVHRLSTDDWLALGRQYLERTARWRRQRPRSTDKLPGNWVYAGAVRAMLPQARIILVRRDPLETCFACYRYLFNGHPYTHDIADLAAYWRDFDRAVRCWKERYPERVRVQVYEELIADPDDQIRALLDFCGLPFEENCLNFHATERRVTTPSASQVREPLRRDTARAGKYGALLDPLRAALGLPSWSPG
jgi:tetratricopeptide (TPR) repeat protein